MDAAPPGAPLNDDYLESLQLNAPGSRLERTNTLRDVRDTTRASVQGDVFAPQKAGGPVGGPAEPTTCPGSSGSYGRTVWYDFYPDASGFAQIQTNGFDAAIAVVPFNPSTAVPRFGRRRCINDSSSTAEKLLARVIKGRAYTVQIGAVGDAGGNLEFLFDFVADADGDGVPDDKDKCDRLRSSSGDGCPTRLRAKVTLRARPLATGIQLLGLSVGASRGSRVSVTCKGCRPQAKRAKTVSFGRLRGQRLRAGTSLVIRVVKKKAIGAYVKYRITRGNFKKVERCLNPGSKKPRRRCG
ncbi:MAG: hypothetical protein AABM66_10970 [Actinomycetota bacterium]